MRRWRWLAAALVLAAGSRAGAADGITPTLSPLEFRVFEDEVPDACVLERLRLVGPAGRATLVRATDPDRAFAAATTRAGRADDGRTVIVDVTVVAP